MYTYIDVILSCVYFVFIKSLDENQIEKRDDRFQFYTYMYID